MADVKIRLYRVADAGALRDIATASVRIGSLRFYTEGQVEAWAIALPALTGYRARAVDGRLTLVAVDSDDRPIAHGELEADGHIDHLYCHPGHIGTGVGSALYAGLEAAVRSLGLVHLHVEASEGAHFLFLGYA